MTIIEVADLTVEVERKWIRHIYLRVSPNDARIRISAPMLMSERAIRQFILSKEEWIKLHIRIVSEKRQTEPREYVSGEEHRYMGRCYRLQLVNHNGPARVEMTGDEQIILYIREGTTKKHREAAMREWYRAELKALIPVLVAKWEEIIGVKASRITIKQMRTIWGSCNHRTHDINFNLELMKKPLYCIEYVVVHELLHIIVRLHNEQFKSLLTHYLPNWRQTKAELNRGGM